MTRQYDDKDMGLMDGWTSCSVYQNGGRSYDRRLCPEKNIDEGYVLITPIDDTCGDRRTDEGWIATRYYIQDIVEHEGRWDADGNADDNGKFDCEGNEITDIPPKVIVEYASCPAEAVTLMLKSGLAFECVGANDAMCGDHREFILVREQNADELETYYAPQEKGRPHWVRFANDAWGVKRMPWDDAYAALERAYELTLGATYYLRDVTDKPDD